MFSKIMKRSIIGIVSFSFLRIKEKDVYNKKGELTDGASTRRYFRLEASLIKSFKEKTFDINLPFINRKIFFAIPFSCIVSIPRKMMDDDNLDLCGSKDEKLTLSYRVINPIKFFMNGVINNNQVYTKNALLFELFSDNHDDRLYDEEPMRSNNWLEINKKILEKRRESFLYMIYVMETMEVDEIEPYTLEVEIRDTYRNECKLLNPYYGGDKSGIIYTPKIENIEAWFKTQLGKYKKIKEVERINNFSFFKDEKNHEVLYNYPNNN